MITKLAHPASYRNLNALFHYNSREISEQLQIVTLNNAIYMGIKNDLSFIFIEICQNRSEAMKVSIYEYDAEKHLRMEKEDSYNDGFNDGFSNGFNDGFNDGKNEGRTEEKRENAISMAELGLSVEQIAKVVKESVSIVQKWIDESMALAK